MELNSEQKKDIDRLKSKIENLKKISSTENSYTNAHDLLFDNQIEMVILLYFN